MGCFTGQPIEITSGTPQDVSGLRKSLISALASGLGQGATPYTGPLGAQTNPLQLMAANMLSQKMGYGGYKSPGYYSMTGQPQGGSISGVDTTPVPRTGTVNISASEQKPQHAGSELAVSYNPTTGIKSSSGSSYGSLAEWLWQQAKKKNASPYDTSNPVIRPGNLA